MDQYPLDLFDDEHHPEYTKLNQHTRHRLIVLMANLIVSVNQSQEEKYCEQPIELIKN